MKPAKPVSETGVLLLSWQGTAILHVLRSLAPEVGRVVLLHGQPDEIVAQSVHARPFIHFNSDAGDDEICAFIRRVTDAYGCTVVFPSDDKAVEFVARCHAQLANFVAVTPTPSLAALEEIRCKARFTRLLRSLDLAHPRSVDATLHASPIKAALAELKAPWMVKAATLTGGRGLALCETESALARACSELEAKKVDYLIQEWTPGPDVDCSLLAVNGRILAWTTQRALHHEEPFAPASQIMMEPHPGLVQKVSRLMAALNWSGLAHVDTVWDERDGSYRLLEVNGRCWASILGSTVAGVNFPRLAVQTALGESFEVPPFRQQRFCWLGLGVRRVLGLEGPRWGWHETDVPFFVEDPWPEIRAWELARTAT